MLVMGQYRDCALCDNKDSIYWLDSTRFFYFLRRKVLHIYPFVCAETQGMVYIFCLC